MHRFLFFLIFNLFIFQSLFSLAPSCVFSPDVNLPILSGAQKEKERVEEDLLRMEKNFVSNDKEVIYQFYVNTVFVAKIKVDKALNLINLIRVDPLKRGEGIGTASLLLMLSDCLIKERDVSELIVIDFTNEMNKVDDIGKKLYLGFASCLKFLFMVLIVINMLNIVILMIL